MLRASQYPANPANLMHFCFFPPLMTLHFQITGEVASLCYSNLYTLNSIALQRCLHLFVSPTLGTLVFVENKGLGSGQKSGAVHANAVHSWPQMHTNVNN